MRLAIFDLDHTLIGGDSDQVWGDFLAESGLVDGDAYKAQVSAFYQDYMAGTLDIHAHLSHSLAPLSRFSMAELDSLHRDYFAQKVLPLLQPKAHQLLQWHRQQGHYLLIITATNRFITAPIAEYLGVDDLIACEAEIIDNRYTGRPTGVPSYREGKVTRLQDWLRQHPELSLEGSYFYSDSHNDLPLLELASQPVAVDPDDVLKQVATERGWEIVSLRNS
ncbi:phosphoserine phosphatase [Pokkaliibacter plantistimulans]|uniref:Phosphoserine phosphatase n=1 Tax=Pokkaliibacter plantistimulans TaxID=1635171 RepID=A0ABX5M2E9_9GAMM|nr:HAD family hydrolase [Pokkaliibacter plantistimulans]PXF31693.1 phosphoserine phosphatase [Pokkaliibacter plantistimulans]